MSTSGIRNRSIKDETLLKQASDAIDSEEEKSIEEALQDDYLKKLSKSTDKTVKIIDQTLVYLDSKWRNYVVRSIFTFFMVIGFVVLIYLGPLALILTTLMVQVKCFQEIIAVGNCVYQIHGLPWFRSLSWYFLMTSNYFFYGQDFIHYFGLLLKNKNFMSPLVTFHKFFSFSLYIIGFLWFVLSLKKRYYMKQFSLFAWTHVTLLIVVTQSYFIITNMFQGLIWFIVPVSMIVCNDVMAYVFGFFWGKTPLIQLSPKKTWEGFIGGGISTVIFGMIFSHLLCPYQYLVCPIKFVDDSSSITCNPSPLFQMTEYDLPPSFSFLVKLFGHPPTIQIYPFVLHSLALSLFSSVIGPFGGFFASGFKRAFKIKDFGDLIPGHGGIMDRFDCQFLMATFVYVYISSFIAAPNVTSVYRSVESLAPEHQVELYNLVRDMLMTKGLLKV